jgi:hypothetical protein
MKRFYTFLLTLSFLFGALAPAYADTLPRGKVRFDLHQGWIEADPIVGPVNTQGAIVHEKSSGFGLGFSFGRLPSLSKWKPENRVQHEHSYIYLYGTPDDFDLEMVALNCNEGRLLSFQAYSEIVRLSNHVSFKVHGSLATGRVVLPFLHRAHPWLTQPLQKIVSFDREDMFQSELANRLCTPAFSAAANQNPFVSSLIALQSVGVLHHPNQIFSLKHSGHGPVRIVWNVSEWDVLEEAKMLNPPELVQLKKVLGLETQRELKPERSQETKAPQSGTGSRVSLEPKPRFKSKRSGGFRR